MSKKYLGGFTSKKDVEREFEVCLEKSIKIVVAHYDRGDYEGSAFVIFKQNGKIYEVNGSHCSCYGLEEQWRPEKTTKKALKMRKLPEYEYSEKDAEVIRRAINSL